MIAEHLQHLAEFAFQYKICYSKIITEALKKGKNDEFQYKICYSKIQNAFKRCDFPP